jgi:hypothetical protein
LHYKKRGVIVARTATSENEKILFPLLEKKGLPPLQAVVRFQKKNSYPKIQAIMTQRTHRTYKFFS